MIEIRRSDGTLLLSLEAIPEGAKGKFTLGSEDYVILPFSLDTPISLRIGDYIDLSDLVDEALGGKFAKRYELIKWQTPTYNKETGGYDYELQFDAYYYKWQNKIFKYTPETSSRETAWNLTAALDVHMGVFLRNLEFFGYDFNGTPFTFDIDDSVEDSAKLISYNNTNLIDALTTMAETWDCEWWVTEHVIHFGRVEQGDYVKLELGVEVAEMQRSESAGTFATRIYAFGADRNLPTNYRPTEESVVVNGVVQRRLMLPEDTPYIDAYRYKDGKRIEIGEDGYDTAEEMPEEEAIENVVTTDDIYPRTQCVVGEVGSYTDTVTDEDTGETVTQTFYYMSDTSGLVFDEDYILPGEELMVVFQSGLLNGMDFAVTFRKAGTSIKGVVLKTDVYEIVANDDYGRTLPDDTLKPQSGDKFVLYNWDSTKIAELGLVAAAEQELKEYAIDYVNKTMVDDGTYNTTLMSDWVYKDQINRTYDLGQRIQLINNSFFEDARLSRIIGYELKLDFPFDAPIYTIGESVVYSRIGALESQIEELTFKGQTYTGSGSSSGSNIYIIKTNDSTAASNTNVYSALRSLAMFLRKDADDEAAGNIVFDKNIDVALVATVIGKIMAIGGVQFGREYETGLLGVGGWIDSAGVGELDALTIRKWLEVPELRKNRVTLTGGTTWHVKGCGIIEKVEIDKDADGNELQSGFIELKLEEGEYGMIAEDDLCMGIFHNFKDETQNDDYNEDTRDGNFHFAGFCTSYFRVDYIVDTSTNKRFHYILRAPNDNWGQQHHPCEFMNFACYANVNNSERQESILITTNYMLILQNMTDWEYGQANYGTIIGALDGFYIDGRALTGNSFYTQNGYYSGVLMQIENAPYELVIEIAEGDNLVPEGEGRTLTCSVKKGYQSETPISWKVSRETGDTAADEEWNAAHMDFDGTLVMEFDDIFGDADSALFRFTATMSDGTEVTNSIILHGYWVEDPDYRMAIDTQGDTYIGIGDSEPLQVTCYVYKGWTDKTDDVRVWSVSRDSGDEAEDAAWNNDHTDFAGYLELTYSDLGENYMQQAVHFTFTASDGHHTVNAEVVVN